MPSGSLQVDFRSGTPIYKQITNRVETLVAAGLLRPGDQLPTMRKLAAELGVNFNTVARAYRLLDERGLISTQHGRGTYILDPVEQYDTHNGLALLTRRYIEAAERTGQSPEQVLVEITKQLEQWQQRLADPTPGSAP